MKIKFTLFIISILVICISVYAQSTNKNNTKPAEQKKETVDGKADYVRGTWGGSEEVVIMKGNVKFVHSDTILKSDEIHYNQKTKTAVSPGKINISNPEIDIKGDKGTAYFNKRIGVVEGNVVMNYTPKKKTDKPDDSSVKTEANKPSTITGNTLEYMYRDKIVSISGNVVFKQLDRTAKASKAVFNQNTEIIVLSGGVNAFDEKGQRFQTPGDVKISIKEGDEWLEAQQATATFKIELDEEETQDSNQSE